MKSEPNTPPESSSPRENGNLWKTCALLLPFFWPVERKDLQTRVVVAVASLVLAKLANLAVPLVLGWAVDTLSNLEDQTDLIFGIPIAALAAYGLSRLSYIVFNEIRDAVFARVSQHAVLQVAI